MEQVPPSPHQGHGQHHAEGGGQQRLERRALDGVAVGCHEPAHGVGEAEIPQVGILQHRGVQQRRGQSHRQGQPVGQGSPAQRGAQDPRHDSQEDGQKGKILHKRPHQSSSFRARSSSSRSSMVP